MLAFGAAAAAAAAALGLTLSLFFPLISPAPTMTFAPLASVAPTVGAWFRGVASLSGVYWGGPIPARPPGHACSTQKKNTHGPRGRRRARTPPPRAPPPPFSPHHSLRLPLSPATFFGLAGVTFMAVPKILNHRPADDIPTMAKDWKRAEAKRALAHERHGAPDVPVVMNPIRRDL